MVPPTHQPRGLPSRLPSLGGDGENQQFSKSDGAGDFHSEKTKLMKETDFSTTTYINLSIALSVPCRFFFCLASESLEKFFPSKGFSIAFSTVNICYSESFREMCNEF